MSGFVRAVAINERLLLGARASPGDHLDLNDIRIDERSENWPARLRSALDTHLGLITLTVSDVAGPARTETLTAALMRVQHQRQATGRPHWLVIDSAESVLHDAGLAPHALDLNTRGHCLVQRRHTTSPPWLGVMDTVQPCSPTCPVPPKRPARIGRPRDDRRPPHPAPGAPEPRSPGRRERLATCLAPDGEIVDLPGRDR